MHRARGRRRSQPRSDDLRDRINQLRRQKHAEIVDDQQNDNAVRDDESLSLSLSSVDEDKNFEQQRQRRSPSPYARAARRPVYKRSKSPPQSRSRSPVLRRGEKKSKKSKKSKKDKKSKSRERTETKRVEKRRDSREFRNRYERPSTSQGLPLESQSWEDKVSQFMKKINKDDLPKAPPPETCVEEPSCDSVTLTPLMKFVAKKLSKQKSALVLSGPFQYSILSLLSRSEWVAARVIQMLEEAGFDNDWLYDNSIIKGGPGLKSSLMEALNEGKVALGKEKGVRDQFVKVIEIIVTYFTSDGTATVESEPEEEPQRAGLSAVLGRISEPSQPPPEPIENQQVHEINHWSMLADNIQSSNLTSFESIESYLSQDLLRVTTQDQETSKILLSLDGRAAKDVFEVARHMVMCWVNAGYSFDQLWNIVNVTSTEDLLPPRDPTDTSGYFIVPNKAKDRDFLAHKFINQFKKMNRSMNDRQIDYVVWKSLVFVMRGCGKSFNSNTNNYNVCYNYLPPGIREMETKTKFKPGTTQGTFTDVPLDMELSEDPMNIIIDPSGHQRTNKETIPRRKYFVCSISIDFVHFKGKPQVYQLGIYGQDMSTLQLYIVPDELKSQGNTLESLGFTLNQNLNKYFFVQSGTGCVVASNMSKAMEKMIQFLEQKRDAADGANKNNGVVLLCKDREELAAFLSILSHTPTLTLETIKGFGLLEPIAHLSDFQLNMVNNDVCVSATVTAQERSEQVLAKSKPEVLFKALEAALQVFNPGYDTFVRPHCFPSDGTAIKHLKARSKKIEEFYTLELYLAAELKRNRIECYLEGIYSASKDSRHKSDIVAHRFCQALVDVNLTMDVLRNKFQSIAVFTINPDLVLNLMDKPQRLKVINQTRACIDFVRRYFRSFNNI